MSNPNTNPQFAETSSVQLAATICAEAERFRDHLPFYGIVRTELEPVTDHPLAALGYDLQIKNETRQPVGSYKLRGATTAILAAQERLHDERQVNPAQPELQFVSCATQGNHGASVAYAAKRLGLRRALIKTTFDADPTKLEQARELGAAVHSFSLFEEAQSHAIAAAELPGHAYIAPFDSVDTMAGQQSVGYEIVEDLLAQHSRHEIDLDNDSITILVPGGGGGLSAATAAMLYEAKQTGRIGDNVKLVVSQMENCDAIARERYGYQPLTADSIDMSCSSTGVLAAGRLPMTILNDPRMVHDVISIPKADVAQAMRFLTSYHDRLVEPAGALSLSGALFLATQQGRRSERGQRNIFVTVTSGANVSYQNFANFHPDTTMPPDSMSAADRQQAVVDLADPTHRFRNPVYRAAQAERQTQHSPQGSGATRIGRTALSRSTRILSSATRRAYIK